MFKKAKKVEKEREFFIHIIEKLGTLEIQNQFLHQTIKELEQRVTDLEIARKAGF